MRTEIIFDKQDKKVVNDFAAFVHDYCSECADCHECIFEYCMVEQLQSLKNRMDWEDD